MIPSFERRRCVGMHLRAFGGDAPDTSRQDAVAERAQNMSEEQWNFARKVWDDSAPEREAATRRADLVADQQITSARKQDALADEAAATYRTVYQPLERQMVDDARSYNTEARREQAAGLAMADVEQGLAAGRSSTNRTLARMGVNPSDGATASANLQLGLAGALGRTHAANTARRQVETVGNAKLADAVNLGRGIASSQATQAGLAAQLGTSGVGNAVTSLNATTAGSGQVQQGASTALGGLGQASNIYGASSAAQSAAKQRQAAGTAAGIGAAASLAGATASQWGPYVATLFAGSDENEKENVEPVDGAEALDVVRKMPVGLWNYRKDSQYADGEQRHVGPMAQSAQAAGGDALAPGGKVIDLISANGLLLSAVQELDKRVVGLADVLNPRATTHAVQAARGPGLASMRNPTTANPAPQPGLADARRL